MDKNNLKALLLPLVRECVKEVLVKELLIKEVVSQLAEGLQTSPAPRQAIIKQEPIINEETRENLKAQKKRAYLEAQKTLEEATGLAGMFSVPKAAEEDYLEEEPYVEEQPAKKMNEGTSKKEKVSADVKSLERSVSSGIKGIDPSDPGINISGLLNLAGGKSAWKNTLNKI